MTKSSSVIVTFRPVFLSPTESAASSKKRDVALLDGSLLEHLAWDAHEAQVDARLLGVLAGDLVQLEGEVPAEDVHALRLGSVLARPDRLAELDDDLPDVADRDRRIHRADMDHAALLEAVEPRVSGQRACVVEIEDE